MYETSHLSGDALKAAKAILRVVKRRIPDARGGSFRLPAEWNSSNYGKDSVLVTEYDGGELGMFLSLDREQYDLVEEVNKELAKIGMYHEECHIWHGAVYKV